MTIERVMNEKACIVFPRAQEPLRPVMRVIYRQSVIIRIKYDDFVEGQPFFPHFIKDLAPEKEVDLAIIILTLESIPSLNFLSSGTQLWEDYIPLAVGRPIN